MPRENGSGRYGSSSEPAAGQHAALPGRDVVARADPGGVAGADRLVETAMPLGELDARLRRVEPALGGPDRHGRVVGPASDHQPVRALRLWVGLDDRGRRHWLEPAEPRGGRGQRLRLDHAASGDAHRRSPDVVRRRQVEAVAGQVDGAGADPVAVPEPQPRQGAWLHPGLDPQPGLGQRVVAAVLRHRLRALRVGPVGVHPEAAARARRGQAPAVPADERLVHVERGPGIRVGAGRDRWSRHRRMVRSLVQHGIEELHVVLGVRDPARVQARPSAGGVVENVEPVAADDVLGTQRGLRCCAAAVVQRRAEVGVHGLGAVDVRDGQTAAAHSGRRTRGTALRK